MSTSPIYGNQSASETDLLNTINKCISAEARISRLRVVEEVDRIMTEDQREIVRKLYGNVDHRRTISMLIQLSMNIFVPDMLAKKMMYVHWLALFVEYASKLVALCPTCMTPCGDNYSLAICYKCIVMGNITTKQLKLIDKFLANQIETKDLYLSSPQLETIIKFKIYITRACNNIRESQIAIPTAPMSVTPPPSPVGMNASPLPTLIQVNRRLKKVVRIQDPTDAEVESIMQGLPSRASPTPCDGIQSLANTI